VPCNKGNFTLFFDTQTNAPQCYGMCTVQSIGEQTTKTTKKDKIWDDTDLTDQFPSPYLPATKKYLHRESVD